MLHGRPSAFIADLDSMTSFIGKMDTLRWTPHMEDCLKVLERDREHPSDEVFVAFVKYQLVAEEAQKLLVRDVMGESSQTPTYIFKKGMLANLQEIHDTLTPNLLSNSQSAPEISLRLLLSHTNQIQWCCNHT